MRDLACNQREVPHNAAGLRPCRRRPAYGACLAPGAPALEPPALAPMSRCQGDDRIGVRGLNLGVERIHGYVNLARGFASDTARLRTPLRFELEDHGRFRCFKPFAGGH